MKFLEGFTPQIHVVSPGRINLIGEHTDYNLGYVLPTAIEKRIHFQLRKNGTEHTCRIYSSTYDRGFTVDLRAIARSANEWENYLLGVLDELGKRTEGVRGFDCVIESNLPTGSGLSSSAALECGLAVGLNDLFALGLSKLELVQLSQLAEHNYVGTQCGIMDQFASVMGKTDHVILLDCRSLHHRHIPIELEPYKILMLNTKVSHNLASSEYNTRKRECEEGVALIQKSHPEVRSLRDLSMEILLPFRQIMDPIIYKRCSFIVRENQRVLDMVEALKEKDLPRVGQLLYEAHEGIRKEYEVSCPESDFLVDFSKHFETVLGARQTGGGFGGCTLNLVHGENFDEFVRQAGKAYKERFGIVLDAFEAKPSGGTSITRAH